MLELTALVVVIILYVIPLNIPLYDISMQTALVIIQTGGSTILVSAVFYVIYTVLVFTIVYYAIKLLVFQNNTILESGGIRVRNAISKYKHGPKHIDIIANSTILLVMLIHLLLFSFDIKIIVLAVISVTFVYRDMKPNGNIQKKKKVDKGTIKINFN